MFFLCDLKDPILCPFCLLFKLCTTLLIHHVFFSLLEMDPSEIFKMYMNHNSSGPKRPCEIQG